MLVLSVGHMAGLGTHLSAAYYTLVLVVAKRTFIANSDKRSWPDVAVTDGTFTVTLVA